MTPWNERPPEVASLLNPAFCALIIRAFCGGFKIAAGVEPSIVLTPLVLPFVLHGPTRMAMPSTSRTKFVVWFLECEAVRANLAVRIERLVPYAHEAIIFGTHHGILRIENNGIKAMPILNKNFSFKAGTEPFECIAAAELLGKLIGRAGSPATIYTLLGISP